MLNANSSVQSSILHCAEWRGNRQLSIVNRQQGIDEVMKTGEACAMKTPEGCNSQSHHCPDISIGRDFKSSGITIIDLFGDAISDLSISIRYHVR